MSSKNGSEGEEEDEEEEPEESIIAHLNLRLV